MKKKYSIIILLLLLIPCEVKAHPGRTDSNGCHYCRTNCSKYGLSDGQYHCHNSNSSPNGSTNNSSNETQEVIKEEVKSNDNTLKSIIIDNTNVEINENIEYTTYNEAINIEVETNNEKATYEIKNNSTLSIGENKIVIEVTAEDGTIRTYNVIVTRAKILSSDTGIKVIINEEEVEFNNYKATIYVESNKESIDFNYKLNDTNAKAEFDKIEELKVGDNILKINVTAEDGTKQIYEITIHKYSKSEDTISNILGFGIIGGIGYLIYKNKLKKK